MSMYSNRALENHAERRFQLNALGFTLRREDFLRFKYRNGELVGATPIQLSPQKTE
jgi:hypothetical protein